MNCTIIAQCSSSLNGGVAQLFDCPTNVVYYAYPDFSDSQCRRYYQCQRGALTSMSCSVGQKYDVQRSRCRVDDGSFGIYCDFIKNQYQQSQLFTT